MRDEYYVGLDYFKVVFTACSQVRLSLKKDSLKGCSICLGRADALAKCHPEEEPGIRVKYEVRFRVLTVFLALLSLLCCRDRSRTAPLPRTPPLPSPGRRIFSIKSSCATGTTPGFS